MVANASDQIQTEARAGSHDFAQALSYVSVLHAAGKLAEAQLLTFAEEGNFDKVAAALSLMCDLPIGLIERAFVQKQTEQILVLARAINISWEATSTLLLLHAGVNQLHSGRDRCDLWSSGPTNRKPVAAAAQYISDLDDPRRDRRIVR